MQTVHLHNFPGEKPGKVRVHQTNYGCDHDIIEVEVAEAPKVNTVADPNSTAYFPEFKVHRLKFKRMFRSELNDVVHYDYMQSDV